MSRTYDETNKLTVLVEGHTSTEMLQRLSDSKKTSEMVAIRQRGGNTKEREMYFIGTGQIQRRKWNLGRFSFRMKV